MTTKTAGDLREIPLADLEVHKANPRTDVGDLSDLVSSIKEHGVQEPILVVRENGHFAIVAGRRRFEASKKAGRDTVPAIIRDLSPEDVATVSLIENLQRKDLDPLEEAEAYRAWLTDTGKSQRDLAAAVGKDESTISNALRLLKAPEPVKEALREQRITAAHARTALELKDPGLASKLPLRPGVRVDELQATVRDLNLAAELNGVPAIAAAKAFLEKARADHPKATITWEKQKDFAYAREVLDLVKTLGKPPVDVVGPIDGGMYGNGPTAATHNKACPCDAYLIEASRDYPKPGLKLALRTEHRWSPPRRHREGRGARMTWE